MKILIFKKRLLPIGLLVFSIIIIGCGDGALNEQINSMPPTVAPASEPVAVCPASSFNIDPKDMPGLKNKAVNGDGEAAYRIALYYEYGPEMNLEESNKWYNLAAKNNHSESQKLVATDLMNSSNPAKQKQAIRWLSKLSQEGDGEATERLAGAYNSGKGVNKDLAKARLYFFKAVMNGNWQSIGTLIYFYTQGIGGPVNINEAVAWLRVYLMIFDPGITGIEKINCEFRRKLMNRGALKNRIYLTDDDIKRSDKVFSSLWDNLTKKDLIKKWRRESADLDSRVTPRNSLPILQCPSYEEDFCE